MDKDLQCLDVRISDWIKALEPISKSMIKHAILLKFTQRIYLINTGVYPLAAVANICLAFQKWKKDFELKASLGYRTSLEAILGYLTLPQMKNKQGFPLLTSQNCIYLTTVGFYQPKSSVNALILLKNT